MSDLGCLFIGFLRTQRSTRPLFAPVRPLSFWPTALESPGPSWDRFKTRPKPGLMTRREANPSQWSPRQPFCEELLGYAVPVLYAWLDQASVERDRHEGGRDRIQLLSEQLRANKQRVQTGEYGKEIGHHRAADPPGPSGAQGKTSSGFIFK